MSTVQLQSSTGSSARVLESCTATGDSATAVLMIGSWRWHTTVTSMILSKYWACGISAVSPRSGSWGPVCVSLQARSRLARESVVALVPSTAGFALGLLRGRRVRCWNSCSLASARQRARSLLALSESAFARARRLISDTSFVSHSRSFCGRRSSSTRCAAGHVPERSRRLWRHYNGHVCHSTETLTLRNFPSQLFRDHWHVLELLHSSFQNALLRNHLDHFSSLLHRNQWYTDVLRGSLGYLYHWHRTAPVGPPRFAGLSVSLAPVVAYELSGWLALGLASQLLRLRSRRCAGPVGAPRSAALLNPKRLLRITTGMSFSCACGISTVFRIF